MKCPPRMGLLKHRVTLQSKEEISDGQGGYENIVWSTVASFPAQVEPMKGYERMQAMQLDAPLTHKVLMRYRKGVETSRRLLFQGRTLDIKEVINESEANVWLRLLCVEVEQQT